jgi:hypothetical protein
MFTRRALLVLSAGSLLPPVAYSSPAPRAGVSVRIYNTAGVREETRHAALTLASRALGASRISVTWFDCEIGDACSRPPAAGELIVRLVRSPRAMTAAAPFVLGEASIDTTARAGILASIYVDCVELMAGLSQIEPASLLGWAIAHEVGHLLLASNAHSTRGLMRARWSPGDLRRNEALDWVLTDEDAAAIRRRLGFL